jgi:sugar phosphate isomerase/epimerase
MSDRETIGTVDRRGFFKTAGAGLTVAGLGLASGGGAAEAAPAQWTEKDKLARIASCSYPIRYIFKTRPNPNAGRGGGGQGNAGMTSAQMKEKYGEITMLDFPQFTKDTFPGVTHMDLFSGLFGDVTDDSMFAGRTFDPSTPSGRKWLDKLAAKMAQTGVKCQHISNNAPTNLAGPDEEQRKAGVEIARKWLEGCAVLGVRSMRMNSVQALGPTIRPNAIPRGPNDGYPRNVDIEPLLRAAIESYKQMADYGGNLGIRVTIENHWGLAADPMNIRTILDEVNHPYCEASPDFCNWEQEYMLVHGLKALAPYAHTNVHAKYWNRWKDNDVRRSVRIMMDAGFQGTFAVEYEAGPWDGVEGSKYLYREVLAAL